MGIRSKLQITPEGYDRYQDLVDQLRDDPDHPQLLRQFNALSKIIVIHPLDYIYKRQAHRYPPRRQDYENLVREGYAIAVTDHYNRLQDTLEAYNPELLPVFRTYRRLVQEGQPSERELNRALSIIRTRMERERKTMAITKELDQLLEDIKDPLTIKDKAIALDTAISRLHWDPDLLRHLPKQNQAVVGGSILAWLNQIRPESHTKNK